MKDTAPDYSSYYSGSATNYYNTSFASANPVIQLDKELNAAMYAAVVEFQLSKLSDKDYYYLAKSALNASNF